MPDSSARSSRTRSRGRITLRALRPADRPLLEDLLRATGHFTEEEVRVALELIDEGLDPASREGYRFVVAELDGKPAGYSCFGRVPFTDGAFDMYWIAVHPRCQRRGVGRALAAAVEQAVWESGGGLVVAETASKPEYADTRCFYEAAGYREEARVRDFYRVGDDKILYVKRRTTEGKG